MKLIQEWPNSMAFRFKDFVLALCPNFVLVSRAYQGHVKKVTTRKASSVASLPPCVIVFRHVVELVVYNAEVMGHSFRMAI